jgi:ribose transport system permease protein
MPQHWINVFIGVILIAAVLGDIWIRRLDFRAMLRALTGRRKPAHA